MPPWKSAALSSPYLCLSVFICVHLWLHCVVTSKDGSFQKQFHTIEPMRLLERNSVGSGHDAVGGHHLAVQVGPGGRGEVSCSLHLIIYRGQCAPRSEEGRVG